MSELTPIELNYIKEKTLKLFMHPLGILYRKPVDPERDNAPDYKDIIKKPMDLGTVLAKIDDNKYRTVRDWSADINLVFENSKKYVNDPNSSIFASADILQKKAQNYFMHVPKNETDLWALEIFKVSSKIEKLLASAPKESIVHMDQSLQPKQ